MKWQRKGDYGMVSEPYRVAKDFVDGCTIYVLYHDYAVLGWFNDFEECQQKAEEHAANVMCTPDGA